MLIKILYEKEKKLNNKKIEKFSFRNKAEIDKAIEEVKLKIF